MLIETLFSKGVMTMGPSRIAADQQVGVFRKDLLAGLGAVRAAEMRKFEWIAGAWNYQNHVPATAVSPAYSDAGSASFSISGEGNAWICFSGADGKERPQITFDPFSRRWIYLLAHGSYGVLRSAEGWVGNRIVFSGLMTMIGIDCEWRMSWEKMSEGAFRFVNEELGADGQWYYIDEWTFNRKQPDCAMKTKL